MVTQNMPPDLNKLVEDQKHQPLGFLGAAFRGAQIHWSAFEKEEYEN